MLYKRLRSVPLYTWVLDLWPESLTAAGGISNKWVLGFFKRFVRSEYRHSDKILISSRSFERSVLEYGDYKEKIVYYPKWSDGADGSLIQPENAPVIPDGFKLMFAGAVGDAEGFAQLAVELSQTDASVLAAKGANAAKYYNEHFVKEKCLRKLDELMGIL